jgi:hypothetical protein
MVVAELAWLRLASVPLIWTLLTDCRVIALGEPGSLLKPPKPGASKLTSTD